MTATGKVFMRRVQEKHNLFSDQFEYCHNKSIYHNCQFVEVEEEESFLYMDSQAEELFFHQFK